MSLVQKHRDKLLQLQKEDLTPWLDICAKLYEFINTNIESARLSVDKKFLVISGTFKRNDKLFECMGDRELLYKLYHMLEDAYSYRICKLTIIQSIGGDSDTLFLEYNP